ncbi:MAG: sulfotransferase [Chloroflexota bacterium]|nr:sulfotransferase [Chloroflexota bacterium]
MAELLVRLKARARRLAVRGSRAWYRWRGPRPPGPPEPPACPGGWQIGPPHYVGVGAQKAGTSWWNRLIEAHPDVVNAGGGPKELHFFDRSWESPFGDADIERYEHYFPVPEGKIAGEWTPGYLIDFWTPELIARAAPDARILVLLRDPVERFRSGLTHQLATSRKPLGHRDIQGAFGRGLYAPQLRRVLAAFPTERVWVGQYEACRADPAAQLAQAYEFLGLSPFELDAATFRGEINPTTREKFEPSATLRTSLLEGYARDMAQLAELLPELDLSLWPSAREVGLT